MGIETSEYINVREKIKALNCNYPNSIAIIPARFETAKSLNDLRMLIEATTVKKLLAASNIEVASISPQKLPFIQNNNTEWIAPTIFYAASVVSSSPDLISISIGIISNYVTDIFKGITNNPTVNLNVVVEKKDGRCTKIEYQGNVAGINEVTRLVKEASRD